MVQSNQVSNHCASILKFELTIVHCLTWHLQLHGWFETLLEHIAVQLNADPLELRVKNFLQVSPLLICVQVICFLPKDGDQLFFEEEEGATFQGVNPLPEIIDYLNGPTRGDYDRRLKEVQEFNYNNAFKKKGGTNND